MKKSTDKQKLYAIIGILIMLFFSVLPIPAGPITPIGMKVIGVFLGSIFLWSTGSMIWPSILAVALLGWFGYMPMGQILKNWMGNPTVVMIFFLLILVGAFQYQKGTQYIARFFLTRKVMEGRPYVFTFIVLLGVYLMATFVNPWAGVFLFLPVVQNVCQELGYQKTDDYTKIMTILVVMSALLGFPSAYFNGTILGLNANWEQVSSLAMPGGAYMASGMIIGLACLLAMVLVLRFVIKPDVELIKGFKVDQVTKNPLPPMNAKQKIVSLAIVIFIAAMLIPVIFPGNPVSQLLKANITGIAMTLVGILGAVMIEGEPVLDFPKVMAHNFSWQTYFMIASSLLIGGALTDESVGFTTLLQNLLTPIFSGMSPLVFTISIVIVAIIITNLMNSAVLVLILHPIIFTYAQVAGADVLPVVMLVTFSAIGFAAITPSASPYAATIFGQKEFVEPSDIYKYASIFVLVETLVALLVGISVVQLFF